MVAFFLWVGAAGVFRWLGADAERRFQDRLRALLPRKVLSGHLAALVGEHRELLPAFRSQALPLRARRLCFDALGCGIFLAARWVMPPPVLAGRELDLLRALGAAVVGVAALADGGAFLRIYRATSGR